MRAEGSPRGELDALSDWWGFIWSGLTGMMEGMKRRFVELGKVKHLLSAPR